MKIFSLNLAIEQSITVLSKNGANKKKIHDYCSCGFFPISEYFKTQDVTNVTVEMIDNYLSKQYNLFKENKIKQWR